MLPSFLRQAISCPCRLKEMRRSKRRCLDKSIAMRCSLFGTQLPGVFIICQKNPEEQPGVKSSFAGLVGAIELIEEFGKLSCWD